MNRSTHVVLEDAPAAAAWEGDESSEGMGAAAADEVRALTGCVKGSAMDEAQRWWRGGGDGDGDGDSSKNEGDACCLLAEWRGEKNAGAALRGDWITPAAAASELSQVACVCTADIVLAAPGVSFSGTACEADRRCVGVGTSSDCNGAA